MTSSSDLNTIETCERRTRVSFNDHLREYPSEPISSAADKVRNSNPLNNNNNNTSSNDQSCLTNFINWWRNIYRRMKRSNHGRYQQSETTVHQQQQQIELEQPTEYNIGEAIRKSTLIQDWRHKTHRQHLFPFKSPYRTIKITDKSSVSIACNDKHILLKQKPNLCLFDKQLITIKEIPWIYDHVDICWSSTLDRFILTTEKIIFTLDQNTMTLEQCSIHIDNEKEWSCGVCSDTSLFLSTGDMSACLYEYTLQPTIEFVKEWRLFSLYPKYEGILTFTYANGKLALIISNVHIFQRRLDLRSSTTLERLWSIQLNAVAHCCSINNDQWIIMELLKPRLLHISFDGKILQEYKVKTSSMDIIWNAIQFDIDTIVTFTMTNLNLHKLS